MFRFFPPKTGRNELLPKVPILPLKEFGFVPNYIIIKVY
jgi:hypothetical protein